MSQVGRALTRVTEQVSKLDSSVIGLEYLNSPHRKQLDRIGSAILRPLVAPIVASAKMAVLLEDGFPTIVQLPRVGKKGGVFQQHKIRTMTKGTENLPNRVALKQNGDIAITGIGRIIRKLSIDELVQLRNVKSGEMSLIGPRPLSPEEFTEYAGNDTEFATDYISMLPGITGLAQVNGREHVSPVERKEFAKQYAAEACLSLDIDILLKTARAVINLEGSY